MLVMKLVLNLVAILLFSIEVLCIDPLVLTSHGLVLGDKASDGNYSLFLGIPFAKLPPENPFGAPVDSDPFEDVYRAFDDSVVCPQWDTNFNSVGTLDCLRANIYVPHLATSKNLLPVMIWIHGGGYTSGYSNKEFYGPKFIVQHNVLLVTFNYRVNIYGFLNVNTSEIPGNAGLKDQLAALRWIKRNIIAFGGDPNNITLFGESAGASSVEFLMLSGLANNLFHKVIMQSGSVFCDWVMAEPNKDVAQKISGHLGFHTNDKSIALDFIKRTEPSAILNAIINLNLIFKPSVEEQFHGVEAIITESPSKLIKTATYPNIPILSGFNDIESLDSYHYYKYDQNYFEKSGKTFKDKLESYFNIEGDNKKQSTKYVQDFYIGEGNDIIIQNFVNEMVQFNSDYTYNYPIHRSTSFFLNKSNVTIYQYIFSYSGKRNLMKNLLNNTAEGAGHADELSYLFNQYDLIYPEDETDQLIIDQVTTMWTNFAKYSNPTPVINNLLPITWEPTDKDARRFLIIDKELHMTYHPYHQRMAFWEVFFKLHEDKMKW